MCFLINKKKKLRSIVYVGCLNYFCFLSGIIEKNVYSIYLLEVFEKMLFLF